MLAPAESNHRPINLLVLLHPFLRAPLYVRFRRDRVVPGLPGGQVSDPGDRPIDAHLRAATHPDLSCTYSRREFCTVRTP